MTERRIIITITHLRDAEPWIYAEANMLAGYSKIQSAPTRGDPLDIVPADGETALLAYQLEGELRAAFAREVRVSGYAAAVEIVRDIAADRAALEGVPIDVEERMSPRLREKG